MIAPLQPSSCYQDMGEAVLWQVGRPRLFDGAKAQVRRWYSVGVREVLVVLVQAWCDLAFRVCLGRARGRTSIAVTTHRGSSCNASADGASFVWNTGNGGGGKPPPCKRLRIDCIAISISESSLPESDSRVREACMVGECFRNCKSKMA